MFGSLMQKLAGNAPSAQRLMDERLALGALLVQIARSDGDYATEEIEQIDRTLAAHFSMSPFEATALRREAEIVEAETHDTVRFTRTIKDHIPHEERLAVMKALWEVVLADGSRDHEEDSILRLAAGLLGISDRDSNIIRRSIVSND